MIGARLDALARARAFDALEHDHYDVLVIGGGITGAGIARDAALRGLHVALVERDDFASGTSSRSSRLIHGGLRYLEHRALHLVFEASRERHILMRIAPHLVRPLPFLWPVYDHSRVPMWKLRAGLMLYDALALFRNVAGHRQLGADRVIAMEPALRQSGLQGGARYYDGWTNDARLTIETIRSAAAAGAVIVNHAEVRSLLMRTGIAQGAVVTDRLSEERRELTIEARVVVNATGPWGDVVRQMADPGARTGLRGTKGVHVLVSRRQVGNEGALTLISPLDDRVIFILPSGQHTLIGTTDTDYAGPPEEVRADEQDITYLLRSANAFFPEARLGFPDVLSAWAGIRPLVADGRGPPTSVSREHAIKWSDSGLLTISGGKLTTYRSMAAQAVDEVIRSRSLRRRRAGTHRQPLPGGDGGPLAEEIEWAERETGAPRLAAHLVHSHGTEWRDVWELALSDGELRQPIADELPYIRAEIVYAVEREMASTIADVLIRRVPVAFETRDQGRAAARVVAPLMVPLLGWDETRLAVELRRYENDVLRMFGVETGA